MLGIEHSFSGDVHVERKTQRQDVIRKTKWPWVVMLPKRVVFTGLVRIGFTLDVVNDKKCVIVLFNLRVFLLSCSSPFPYLTKPHTDDTWELSWAGRRVIPPATHTRTHTLSGYRRAENIDGMWTGTGKWGALWCPRLRCFLQEHLLAQVRQQLWILHCVVFGGGDYFHRKNIFIDKTENFIWKASDVLLTSFVWFVTSSQKQRIQSQLLNWNYDSFCWNLHIRDPEVNWSFWICVTAECRGLGLASVRHKIWVGGRGLFPCCASDFSFNDNLISMTFLAFYTKINQLSPGWLSEY